MIAFVFPGQGSQSAGMGAELIRISPAAARVLEEASDVSGLNLAALDEAALAQTRFAQLAIVTHSLAAYAALTDRLPVLAVASRPCAYAGFSLGEYSALCAAGRLSLADTIRLVSRRSELMQDAAEAVPGAMSAILGLSDEAVMAVLANPAFADRVYAVNYNAPGQLVIAGEAEAVAAISDPLKAAGARRIVPLAVNGAFHTRLMAPAAAPLMAFARTLPFAAQAGKTVYSNRSGKPLDPDADVPAYLADHLQNPVLWTSEVRQIASAGYTNFVECGSGRVLSGLIRKIDSSLSAWQVEDEKSLLATIAGLEGRLA